MKRIAEWIIKGGKGQEEPAIGLFPMFVWYIREIVRYIRRRRKKTA